MANQALQTRGHLETCPFVNNHSPACGCDGTLGEQLDDPAVMERRRTINAALLELGWTSTGAWPWPSYYLILDEKHRLLLGKTASGWQFLWAKSMLTIREEGSFGTPKATLQDLWATIAKLWDQHNDLAIEAAMRNRR